LGIHIDFKGDGGKMKRFFIYLTFIIVCIPIFAQNSIEIITQISKPYSPYFSDYIDGKNTSLIIRNIDTVPHKIMLYVTIEGDNGVRINSKRDSKPFSPLGLGPGETKQIMGFMLINYLPWRDLEITGINKEQILRTNALPEGSYKICFQALDYENGEPLSPASPEGCEIFEVIFPDVPQLVLPNDNDSITTRNGLIPTTFVWTPPLPTPAHISYKLQIAESPDPSMDPNQVLEATTKLYLEKELKTTNYTTQPTDPPLQDGRSYCWRVVAYDPTGAVLIKNNGKSIAFKFYVTRSVSQISFDTTITPQDTTTWYEESKEEEKVSEQKEQRSSGTGSQPEFIGRIIFEIPNCISPTEYKDVETFSPKPLKLSKDLENQHYRNLLKEYGSDVPIIEIRNDRDFYLAWSLEPLNLFLNKEILFKISIFNQINLLVANFSTVQRIDDASRSFVFYAIEKETIRNYLKHNYKYFCIVEAIDMQGNIIGKSEQCLFRFIESFPKYFDERFTTYKIKGSLKYSFQGYENETFPVNLLSFKLYKRLLVKDELGNIIRENLDPKDFVQFTSQTPDYLSVSLDEKGFFTAEVISTKENGFLADLENYQILYPVPELISGKLYEYYTFDLEDPYYINPQTKILLNAKDIELGEVVAYVLSYQLNIYITKKYKGGKFVEYNPDGIKVAVYRFSNNDIPYYEGEIKSTEPKIPLNELKFVSKGKIVNTIDEKGRNRTLVVVDKLICNQLPNDYYLIDIVQEKFENGEKKVYISDFTMKPFKFNPEPDELFSGINNKLYNFMKTIDATIISLEPPSATLRGKIVETNPADPTSPPKPLSNKRIGLMLTYLIKDIKGNFTVIDPYHILKDLQSSRNKSISGNIDINFYDSLNYALQNQFQEGNQIVATTVTDGQGNFVFENFVHYDSLKTFSGSFQMNFGSGLNSGFINLDGEIIKAFRVVLCGQEQEYYYNPSKNIIIQPFDSIDVGTLEVIPKTYSLIVIPRKRLSGKNQFEEGSVILNSKVEISRSDLSPSKIEVVRNNNGATFYGLKLHNSEFDYDDYKIAISTSDTVGENALQTRTIFFPRGFIDWKNDPIYRKSLQVLENPQNYTQEEVLNAREFCKKFENLQKRKISKLFIGFPGIKHFTDEFEPIFDTITVYLEPKSCKISGRILDGQNPQRSVKKGIVYLILSEDQNPADFQLLDYRFVSKENQNGYFEFDNLPIKAGVKFRLKVSCPGYYLYQFKTDKVVQNPYLGSDFIPPLQSPAFSLAPGEHLHLPHILMMPKGKVIGYVENEQGDPVEAFVRSTVSNYIKTNSVFDEKSNRTKQIFELQSAVETNDTVFILPLDSRYFPDTIPIKSIWKQSPEVDLGRVIVKERSHKIRINVFDEKTFERLTNFKVEFAGQIYTSDNSNQGISIVFKNPDVENFQIKIYPDPNSNYVPLFAELTNKETKDFIDYNFYLSQGYELFGVITHKDKPVADAKVFVMIGNIRKEAKSASDGTYNLKGIPAFQLDSQSPPFAEIFCVAPDQPEYESCYGVSTKVTFSQNRQKLDFELPSVDHLNLSKLYGFKIKITEFDSISTSRYRISGFLPLNEIRSNFKLSSENQNVAFSNIIVQPSINYVDEKGRHYLEHVPELGYPPEIVSLDLPSLLVIYRGDSENLKYNILASQQNANESLSLLSIFKETPISGAIKSPARILLNSFRFPQSFIRFGNDQFFLNEKEGNNFTNLITLFNSKESTTQKGSDKSLKEGIPYYLSDRNGRNLRFKLFDFDTEADIANSILKPDGEIQMQASISSHIILHPQNYNSLKINLNTGLSITPDSINSIGRVSPFTISLESWKLSIKNSLLSSRYGGFYSNDAEILANNLNIPVRKVFLHSSSLNLQQISLKNLPIALGKVLYFKHNNFRFGIDPGSGNDSKPHFKISIAGEPAAELSGLTGFNSYPLKFDMVSLLSNGELTLSFSNENSRVPFFEIAFFKPQAINLFEDAIQLTGTISFDIPRLSNEIPSRIKFHKFKGKDTFDLSIAEFSFMAPGNVEFVSNLTTGGLQLKPGELKISGKVLGRDYLAPFEAWLIKSNSLQQTRINIEKGSARVYFQTESFPPDKGFLLDSIELYVNMSDWSFLTLKLIPSNGLSDAGFGNSPLYLTAYGVLRTNETKPSSIAFKDFPAPYDDFSLWYDNSNARLFGNINLQRTRIENVSFEGSGELQLDRNGFFVAGNGKMFFGNFEPIVSGILIGNYESKHTLGIPPSSFDRVFSNSIGKEIPCKLENATSINGLFATGRFVLSPVQFDTTIDINSTPVQILCFADAELSLWKSFNSTKSLEISAIISLNLLSGLTSHQNCTEIDASSNTILKIQTQWPKGKNFVLNTTESIPLFGKFEQKEIFTNGCGKTLFLLGGEGSQLLSLPVTVLFNNISGFNIFFGGNYLSNSCSIKSTK